MNFPTPFPQTCMRRRCTLASVLTVVYLCIDGAHLLVETRSHRLFTARRPGTIPCRPTRPGVSITLTKAGNVVPVGDNVAFDPRTGFTVRRANHYFDGFFTCNASSGRLTSRQSIIIKYRGELLYSTFS